MEETIRRYAHLMMPPGEHHYYSNLGYGLLDYLISRVSGRPYAEFMRQEVFLPLDMTHSAIDVPPYLSDHAATRYGADDVPYPPYTFDHPGGSAAWSSAHDLVRFGMFHIDGHSPGGASILTPESRAAMLRNPASIDVHRRYGLGWGVTDDEFGYRTIVHDGGMGGVRTALWLVPSERLAVAILVNSTRDTPFSVWDLRDAIAATVLPDFMARKSIETDRNRAGTSSAAVEERFPEELIGDWEGTVHTYEGDVPIRLWIGGRDHIRVRLGEDLVSLLNDVSTDGGYLHGRMLGSMPTADARKRPHQIYLDLVRLRGERLTASVTALRAPMPDGGAPDRRMGNALTHFAELRRPVE